MCYDQDADDRDFEFNARYDYAREAYGNSGDSPAALEAEMEWCAREEAERLAVEGAAFGPLVSTRRYQEDDIPF